MNNIASNGSFGIVTKDEIVDDHILTSVSPLNHHYLLRNSNAPSSENTSMMASG